MSANLKRNLSTNLKRQLFTPHRDKELLVLLTVGHRTFTEPFRFVSGDPREFEYIVSNSRKYITFPFEISLLTDSEDSEPTAEIKIQNADDRIGNTILGLPSDALTVDIQVIMRETPDQVELEALNMELVDIRMDSIAITGRLILRGSISEPCPGRRLTNRVSPVFFR